MWSLGIGAFACTLRTKRLEVRMSISQVAALLPEHQFAYCHRTLLVNLAYVRHPRYCELELKSGERLPISKYRLAQLQKRIYEVLESVKERFAR